MWNFKVMNVRSAFASQMFLYQVGKVFTFHGGITRVPRGESGWQKQRKRQRSECNCFPCCLLAGKVFCVLLERGLCTNTRIFLSAHIQQIASFAEFDKKKKKDWRRITDCTFNADCYIVFNTWAHRLRHYPRLQTNPHK